MRGACLCGEMRMRVLGVKCEGENDEYSCVCAVKIECAERGRRGDLSIRLDKHNINALFSPDAHTHTQ